MKMSDTLGKMLGKKISQKWQFYEIWLDVFVNFTQFSHILFLHRTHLSFALKIDFFRIFGIKWKLSRDY